MLLSFPSGMCYFYLWSMFNFIWIWSLLNITYLTACVFPRELSIVKCHLCVGLHYVLLLNYYTCGVVAGQLKLQCIQEWSPKINYNDVIIILICHMLSGCRFIWWWCLYLVPLNITTANWNQHFRMKFLYTIRFSSNQFQY